MEIQPIKADVVNRLGAPPSCSISITRQIDCGDGALLVFCEGTDGRSYIRVEKVTETRWFLYTGR